MCQKLSPKYPHKNPPARHRGRLVRNVSKANKPRGKTMDLKVKELKPKVHQQSLIKLNQTVAQNSHSHIAFDASEISRSPVDIGTVNILIYLHWHGFPYIQKVVGLRISEASTVMSSSHFAGRFWLLRMSSYPTTDPWDWYIYLHLASKSTKCREIYRVTWILCVLGSLGQHIHQMSQEISTLPQQRFDNTRFQRLMDDPPAPRIHYTSLLNNENSLPGVWVHLRISNIQVPWTCCLSTIDSIVRGETFRSLFAHDLVGNCWYRLLYLIKARSFISKTFVDEPPPACCRPPCLYHIHLQPFCSLLLYIVDVQVLINQWLIVGLGPGGLRF